MWKRVVTGFIIFPLALAVLLSTSPWPLAVVVVIVLSLSLGEMADLKMTRHVVGQLIFLTLVGVGLAYFTLANRIKPDMALGVLLGLSAYGVGSVLMVIQKSSHAVWRFGTKCWVLAPLLAALSVQFWTSERTDPFHLNPVILLFLPIWAGDTAAYFAGKAFGRRKLWPEISPKKTWEGAVANVLAAIAMAIALGSLFKIPMGPSAVMGLEAGIFGQYGDLLQSALKRSVGVKDSGWILPGHGGILDRLDSFFLAGIPIAITLWLMAPQVFHVKH